MIGKMLLISAISLSSGLASAKSSVMKTEEFQVATKLCASLTALRSQERCDRLVAASYHFNRQAVSICAQVDEDADRIRCLRTIANERYSDAQIRTCKNAPYPLAKVSCLREAASAAASEPVWLQQGRNGKQSAATVCRSTTGSTQSACQKLAQGGRYFDYRAVEACGSLVFGSDRLDCLTAIKDKMYRVASVNVCREELHGAKRIECFKDVGISVDKF